MSNFVLLNNTLKEQGRWLSQENACPALSHEDLSSDPGTLTKEKLTIAVRVYIPSTGEAEIGVSPEFIDQTA